VRSANVEMFGLAESAHQNLLILSLAHYEVIHLHWIASMRTAKLARVRSCASRNEEARFAPTKPLYLERVDVVAGDQYANQHGLTSFDDCPLLGFVK
jgi:hypothetical protein